MSEVATLGEAMTLFLAEPGRPLGDAALFERSVAGAEANVAIGLARLGHQVSFIGRVGSDVFGDGVRRMLRGEGVEISGLLIDTDRPTGLLVRDVPVGRPVTVVYHRTGSAGAGLRSEDIDPEVVSSAKILHITGITAALSTSARAAVEYAVGIAVEAGVPISFDPNVRLQLASLDYWSDLVATLAPHADTVLVGADELRMLGRDVASFLNDGASTVVVKDGARGAWVTDGTETHQVPARSVTEVDPVGAGDAFAAGWLSGTLRNLPIGDRLREAAVVASCVVAARGDVSGLPDSATRDRLNQGHVDVLR